MLSDDDIDNVWIKDFLIFGTPLQLILWIFTTLLMATHRMVARRFINFAVFAVRSLQSKQVVRGCHIDDDDDDYYAANW
jgi:hypothetical protein